MLKIEFHTKNAAFADGNGQSEAAHIVRAISELIILGQESGPVRDSNGNAIGEWSLTIDADQEGGE